MTMRNSLRFLIRNEIPPRGSIHDRSWKSGKIRRGARSGRLLPRPAAPAASAKSSKRVPWQASLFESSFTHILDWRLPVDQRLAFARRFAFLSPAGEEGRWRREREASPLEEKAVNRWRGKKITNSFQDMGEGRLFEGGGA
jgi:hypothetical protein